jgi:hypothetical protein
MTRQALGLPTASQIAIPAIWTNRNPVKRIGAFPEVLAKKAALGKAIASKLPSGFRTKPIPQRALFPPKEQMTAGFTRPLPSLSGWRSGQTRYDATSGHRAAQSRPRGAKAKADATVGAKPDPLKGCAIIAVRECQKVNPFTQLGSLVLWPKRVTVFALVEWI